MNDIMNFFGELTLLSVGFRLVMAALLGSIVGIERANKRYAAGIRTFALVCLGSALATITGLYFAQMSSGAADISRIPAQLLCGIGFLGAGTIIVTDRRQVKGLTTAAGLWASACMGLAAGAGYYSCVLVMCLLIFLVLEILHKVDKHYIRNSKQMYLYVETVRGARVGTILSLLSENRVQVYSFDHFGTDTEDCTGYRLNVEIENRALTRSALTALVSDVEGVVYVSEI